MKRLFRSNSDKKLAGICGGLGEMLDVDPTVIRLVAVALAIITGVIPFLVGYVVAWLIVPPAPSMNTPT